MSQAPEQRGDERVLYLHSTGTTPAMWRRVPPAAFGGAVGLAPAHIGYPPNAPLPRGVICRAEEDAAQALDALPPGVTGVHLVGHSYGALVALHVAQALGPKVRSLFLYEPVVFGALLHDDVVLDPEVQAEVRGFVNHPWFLTDEARLGGDEWLELFIDYWNHPGAWRGMPEPVKAATRALSWKMVQEVRSCFFSAGRFSDLRMSAPLTLVFGERTTRASRAMTQGLAAVNPHAEVIELEGIGHMGPITHPSVVRELLLRHADGVLHGL